MLIASTPVLPRTAPVAQAAGASLARRVIICLLFNEGVLSRTKQFVADYRYTQAFAGAGDADEIILLDITRSGPWPGFPRLVESYCRRLDIPAGAGGHVRSWAYAKQLLNAGCEKVVVGWGGKGTYEEISGQVGCQSLVAGIDFGNTPAGRMASAEHAGIAAVARECESLGAGEILLASIERDGSLRGYDLPTLRNVVEGHGIHIPVVVSGGCGTWRHFAEAFQAGAAGAATSNIHHLTPASMRACKLWLAQNYDGPIREAEAA